MSLTNKILEAAMRSSQHVFVQYNPHVNGIRVYAHPSDTVYESDERIHLIDKDVYLDWEGADERLEAVLQQIEELG